MAGKKRPTAEKDQAKKAVADKKDNGKEAKKGAAKSKTPTKGKKAAAKPAAAKKKAAPKKSNGQPKNVAPQVPEPAHEAVKLDVAEKEEVQVIPAEPVVKAMVDVVIEAAAEAVVVDEPMMNGHHAEPEVVEVDEDAPVVD